MLYVSNALSPAKIISVKIDEKNRGALVLVPEDQISLAIGQRGQNVRLAAKLTGWKIDVKSEKMLEDEKKILNENQEENTEEIKKSKKSTTTPQEAPISEEEQTDLSQSENLSEENNDKKN